MKKLLTILLVLVFNFSSAHPGVGIVKDSKGNIFYTDLKHIWKIDIEGKRSVVVAGVHSHELYIDKDDNLFGEHLWYNGEKVNTWGHYIWCYKNDGQFEKIIDQTKGFLTNYSFTRDAPGNMYWVERFTVSRIMKKTPDGKVNKIIEGKFGFIGWLTVTNSGTLYFTENNKLHKLTADGTLSTVTDYLGSKSPDFSVMGRNYDSYGIWTDEENNIYIAMIDSKKVICIAPDGTRRTILQADGTWTVFSGLFDNYGNMWVLENSLTNDVRARKIAQKELVLKKEYTNTSNLTHITCTVIIAFMVLLLGYSLRISIEKKAQQAKSNNLYT